MDPVAFKIGSLTIHWYGIFMATGLGLGMWTATLRGTRIGLKADDISNLFFWIIVSGIIGAKLLYVINHWDGKEPLKNLILDRSGLVFHGALIGTTIAILIFTHKNNISLWDAFDTLAPSFSLGHALGRIGCLMTGCCYGKLCSLPWAVQFPKDSMPYASQVKQGLLEQSATHSLHIHPTQIYESFLNFALYGMLAWLFRKRKFGGQIVATYVLGYAGLRFFMEFLRGDNRGRLWFDSITSGQGISILLLIGGGVLWWKLRERNLIQKPEEA
ncbi:MAG: prolipoprotein diacylglyceryl transferase [Verrucomicrobiota bacterium]|nr:prolipoprotein diacylglyceryl transferase [Verrucomicrobiota bacterium]